MCCSIVIASSPGRFFSDITEGRKIILWNIVCGCGLNSFRFKTKGVHMSICYIFTIITCDELNASKKAAGGSSVKTVRLPMKRSVGGQLIMTFRSFMQNLLLLMMMPSIQYQHLAEVKALKAVQLIKNEEFCSSARKFVKQNGCKKR